MKKILTIAILIFHFSVLSPAVAENKMQISLSFSDEKILVELANNPTTQEFVNMLPLRLMFRDYVGEEKISPRLPKALPSQSFENYNPAIGDFFYFAPWGNLGIFYNHAPEPYPGLVPLGKLKKTDWQKIQKQKNDFEILVEKEE